jgi:hypothetical protein
VTRVIAHLGAHKTGTSLIQKFMRDKPEQIVPFSIDAISRTDTNTLIGWGHALLDTPDLLTERLAAEVATGARYVILSHENTLGRPHRAPGKHLYPEAEPRIASLARILRPHEAKVIFYLRPQASFLESYYLQLIQQGETFTFEVWLDRVDFSLVSWRPLVEMLRSGFGPDRVVIADFEEIRAGQEEFLRRFFQRIDPAIDIHPDYGAHRNLSISEKGLRIALAANPFLRTTDEKKAMRDFLQRHFNNAKYPRPVLFTEEQRRDLAERYDAEYRALLAGS